MFHQQDLGCADAYDTQTVPQDDGNEQRAERRCKTFYPACIETIAESSFLLAACGSFPSRPARHSPKTGPTGRITSSVGGLLPRIQKYIFIFSITILLLIGSSQAQRWSFGGINFEVRVSAHGDDGSKKSIEPQTFVPTLAHKSSQAFHRVLMEGRMTNTG